METIWFCLIALMLAMYVVLDGFDLGAGIIHLGVARTDGERRAVLASIGPVWDGNEVWLIAAGGTLYFAFPALYASGFSGFYLPLMIVLWLLILRGSSIEFRNHIKSKVWDPLWDLLFCASSLLLAVFFGAALANVVRGVPLDASGYFFEPLWTNFRLGEETGILDWYTTLVGRGCAHGYCDGGNLRGAAASEGELCHLAVGICFAAAGGGRAGGGGVRIEKTRGTESVFRFQRLSRGHADERGFRRLSHGASGAESRVLAHSRERQGRGLRIEGGSHLVDCWDDSCCVLLHVRVPVVCWESGGG